MAHGNGAAAKHAVAIALGGGAPNLTLMTGALTALSEAGVMPRVITTTGAGMVAGLIFAAPRQKPGEDWKTARERTLRETREMGIDDLIYSQFPINYKIFQKPGKMAESFSHAVNPSIWGIPRDSRRRRLLGDTLGFMAAMASPASLTMESQGLCQPPPWIELLVDFGKLRENLDPEGIEFGLSAYCIEEQREHFFRKDAMSAEHFKAGLAMPFLYAPYPLRAADGKQRTYLEGSAIRTMQFNPDDVMVQAHVSDLIYFDLMGHRNLMRRPKHIVDAWGKSIVAPLTQLASNQEKFAQLKEFVGRAFLLNYEIIDDFNKMTMAISARLARLREGPESKLQALAEELHNLIEDHRAERLAIIDRAIEDFGYVPIHEALGVPKEDLTAEALDPRTNTGKRNMEKYIDVMLAEWERVAFAGDEHYDPSRMRVHRMPFKYHIPEDVWDGMLDWSHSNMSRLWDIGYDTARRFIWRNADRLGVDCAALPWTEADIEDMAYPYRPEQYLFEITRDAPLPRERNLATKHGLVKRNLTPAYLATLADGEIEPDGGSD